MNKQKVIETLIQLPAEFSTEELIDRLLFVEKVEQGQKDVKDGKVITMEEVQSRMQRKWMK